jgi:hypothetical protein
LPEMARIFFCRAIFVSIHGRKFFSGPLSFQKSGEIFIWAADRTKMARKKISQDIFVSWRRQNFFSGTFLKRKDGRNFFPGQNRNEKMIIPGPNNFANCSNSACFARRVPEAHSKSAFWIWVVGQSGGSRYFCKIAPCENRGLARRF